MNHEKDLYGLKQSDCPVLHSASVILQYIQWNHQITVRRYCRKGWHVTVVTRTYRRMHSISLKLQSYREHAIWISYACMLNTEKFHIFFVVSREKKPYSSTTAFSEFYIHELLPWNYFKFKNLRVLYSLALHNTFHVRSSTLGGDSFEAFFRVLDALSHSLLGK